MCWTYREGTWEAAQRKGSFTKAFIDLHKQEFPQIEFVKCVFVGKKHTYVLWEEAQSKGPFTKAFIDLHKQEFPQIEFVKCVCVGKKHTYANRNHYCAHVHAVRDLDVYRDTMLALGRYHCRDIHQWEGGSCSFQVLVLAQGERQMWNFNVMGNL